MPVIFKSDNQYFWRYLINKYILENRVSNRKATRFGFNCGGIF